MGRSGNPAKQAERQLQKSTLTEVRAAVEAGRKPIIRWTDKTSVLIDSKDADEAVMLVEMLQPLDQYDPSSITAYLHTWQLMCMMLAQEPRWRASLGDAIVSMVQAYEQGCNDVDDWRRAYYKKTGHMPPVQKIRFYTAEEIAAHDKTIRARHT